MCPSFQRSGLDYESGGQEFESLRARQHLATTYRAKITSLLRDLQGSQRLTPTLPKTPRFFAGTFQRSYGLTRYHRHRLKLSVKKVGL